MLFAQWIWSPVMVRGGGGWRCAGWRELAEAGHVRPPLLGPPCSSPLNACRAVNIYIASCERPECLPPMLVAPQRVRVCVRVWAMQARCFSWSSHSVNPELCVCVCVCVSDEALPLVSPQFTNTGLWLLFRPRLWAPSMNQQWLSSREAVAPRSTFSDPCKWQREKDGRSVCLPRPTLYMRLRRWHHVFAGGTFS